MIHLEMILAKEWGSESSDLFTLIELYAFNWHNLSSRMQAGERQEWNKAVNKIWNAMAIWKVEASGYKIY